MKLSTKKGYPFFEVSSAFQKSIRRNREDDALYWMVEMFNSGYDEYVWKRLKIIVSEDIGIAEPNLPAVIHGLYESYQTQKKKKHDRKPERLFLTHAVVLCCRANKSRLIDWYVIGLWRNHDSYRMPIPDYAIDMHNPRGKKLGRGLEHFYNEGTELFPHTPVEFEDNVKAWAYEIHKKHPGKVTFDPVSQAYKGGSLFDDQPEEGEQDDDIE